MIYKKHILTKSDITSQIHLPCKSFTKDSIEYKVVMPNAMTVQIINFYTDMGRQIRPKPTQHPTI